ncbi:MAG: hypothetical protein AAFU64_02390, partial [Bacteroidota bacterium]
KYLTQGLGLLGSILILFNLRPRIGSALLALSILLTILSCRPCYADSRMYFFSLFFLLSLFQKGYGGKLLQWQVIILYFGSGANKLFDLDWQSGQYIDNWLTYKLEAFPYLFLDAFFPPLWLAWLISWSVILIELTTATLLMAREKYHQLALGLGILMHSGSVIVVNDVWGSFVAGVLLSYLAFIPWPKRIKLILPPNRLSRWLMKYPFLIDPYEKIEFELREDISRILLERDQRRFSGLEALRAVILYCPVFYLLLVAFVLSPAAGFHWVKGFALMGFVFLMLPWPLLNFRKNSSS